MGRGSLPYVAVAYKSATGVGTIQLGYAGQMAVALEGGRLLLPATCDHVALYSQTGASSPRAKTPASWAWRVSLPASTSSGPRSRARY